MNELWELIIYCENSLVYTILGVDQEVKFRKELTAWKDFASLQSFEDIGTDAREVSGLARAMNMDLMPATLEYRFKDVQGMMLQRVK